MKVIAEFVDSRNGKRYFPGDGDRIDPPLEDKQLARLKQARCIADGEEGDGKPSSQPDLRKLNVVQLKEYAAEHGVDLGDATKKDDIIAAIELHQETKN